MVAKNKTPRRYKGKVTLEVDLTLYQELNDAVITYLLARALQRIEEFHVGDVLNVKSKIKPVYEEF